MMWSMWWVLRPVGLSEHMTLVVEGRLTTRMPLCTKYSVMSSIPFAAATRITCPHYCIHNFILIYGFYEKLCKHETMRLVWALICCTLHQFIQCRIISLIEISNLFYFSLWNVTIVRLPSISLFNVIFIHLFNDILYVYILVLWVFFFIQTLSIIYLFFIRHCDGCVHY